MNGAEVPMRLKSMVQSRTTRGAGSNWKPPSVISDEVERTKRINKEDSPSSPHAIEIEFVAT